MKFCTVNGNEKSEISINDRGFSYGDGLFTTARIIDGEVLMLTEHINRLVYGSNKLGLAVFDSNKLQQDIKKIAKSFHDNVLKVMITAGCGGRGYSRLAESESQNNIIIMVFDFPHHYHEWKKTGITLGVSEQKIGLNPMLSQLKHLNRLEQVLLRAELDQQAEDDLVVMNVNGHIIETTSSNLFWWKNDKLYTPELKISGVAGLMRKFILEHQHDTIVSSFHLSELMQSDEIFICNSVTGIVPIRKYKDRALPINKSIQLRRAINV